MHTLFHLGGYPYQGMILVTNMLIYISTILLSYILNQYHFCIDVYLFHRNYQTYENIYLPYGIQLFHIIYGNDSIQYPPDCIDNLPPLYK